MAANDLVREFKTGRVQIFVYEATHSFVAADQAGWLEGTWETADEALSAALAANGLQGQLEEKR